MSESFRVVGPDGKQIKVNPKKGKYQPKPEETKKRKHYYDGGDVNGVTFPAGFYIWPFWDAPVVSDDDKPAQPDNGSDASQAPAPDSSPSYEPSSPSSDDSSSGGGYSSSSYDSGSSSSDSGSSGGSDGGGGGGGGD